MKHSVSIIPASPFQEKTASSLVLDEAHPLSEEELAVNSVLDELSNFYIEKRTSDALVYGARALFVLVLIILAFSVPLTATFAPTLVQSGWGILTVWGAAMGGMHLFVKFCIRMENRFSRPNTDLSAVVNRQATLRQAVSVCRSPVLRGKLSELFFLCDNANIDRQFWEKLTTHLDVFVATALAEKVSEKDMNEERQAYRALHLNIREHHE